VTNSTTDTGATGPGQVPLEKGRKTFWDSASFIWAIPVIALVVAVGAAWRNYSDQGPLIEVSFENAAGIKADETQLRYRDIAIGTVEEISFSQNLTQVVASIRVDKSLANYIDAESQFWIVRPEVTARGVSGLDTVLSGVYIQGNWDNEPGPIQTEFEGQSAAPLLGLGRSGVTFVLRSDDGLPGADTPILYKGVEVGVIGDSVVNDEGTGVSAPAVIYDPFTSFVTTSTRFWDISGFSFSVGATGAQLNFNSLASLISGGITFEAIGSGGTALSEGAVFQLFPDETTARDDFLVADDGQAVDVSMVFEQNLAGLASGAAVELGGLRVGEITGINGIVDRDRFGDSDVRPIATARINPGRIGLGDDAGEDALFAYLDDRIDEGLRARLTNASIFTGGLKVELVELPGAAAATLDRGAEPLPLVPTAVANVTDVGATAQGVLQRVDDLPIEEVMQSITDFLNNASALIGSEDLQRAPAELTGILSAVRGVAESDGVQGLPDQISGLLDDLQDTSDTLNRVIAVLEEQDAAGKLTTAIENVGIASETLPDLVADVRAVLQNAEEVPLADLSQDISDLLASAETFLADADALISGDAIQALPQQLNGILSSVRDITASADTQALPTRVTELLTGLQDSSATLSRLLREVETQDTVGKLTAAVDDVAQAADGLPAIVEQARGIVENANAIPLDRLSDQATQLLASANALVDQESTRALPGELNAALDQVRAVLSELQDGGLVANANRTLASAGDAADAIAQASATLPRLADDLRAVANQAGTTLSTYADDSTFTRETRGAIRQIQSAAEAIERLARTIERNPNSLILGR